MSEAFKEWAVNLLAAIAAFIVGTAVIAKDEVANCGGPVITISQQQKQ